MKTILYVEDNLLNVMVVQSFLCEKYQVEHAVNAAEGMDKVKEKLYDLILMDIHLGKGMNGIELTKVIRELEGYGEKPIIAVTGYAMFDDRVKLLKEGLTDYLAKPFDREAITNIIMKNIGNA